MAQYDGSIRINTQIDSKNASAQLMSLENRLVKTADKVSSLRSRMDSLKNAKVPTQEYAEIQKQIAKAESEFNKLLEKQEQMQREGKDSGVMWDRLDDKMEQVGGTLQSVRGELQYLVDTGKAFALGKNTQEYADLSQKLRYAQNDFALLTQRKNEFNQKNAAAPDGYERLRNSLSELKSRFVEVINPSESMKERFISAAESMKEKAAGVAASVINGIAHPVQSIGRIAKSAGSIVVSAFSRIGSIAKSAGKSLLGVASNIMHVSKNAKSASGGISSMGTGFKNMIKNALGISSIYMLFNKLRTAMKDGFKNLAQVSDPVNKSISSLMSALTRLKNSLATAFAPILTAIAPALTTLINMISAAVTKIGMLIAALTGQKTFTKATAVQEDYAASLKNTSKEAKKTNKQLSSLDKLNNLTTNDNDDGGSGGGGGTSPSDMFETVDITPKISDFAKKLKEAWEKADFTEIGGIIGTKLKNALDNIPWDGIKKSAAKIGKSLATLINGFVEVPGLGYSIGNAIAQAINTGITGLESFAKNLHWDSVGTFIAEGINGVLENIDWETALSAASYLGTGLATMLNSALTPSVFSNIGKTIGMGINTSLTFANDFLTTFKWTAFGANIATGISEAITTIDWGLLGDTVANSLNALFHTFSGFVSNFPWSEFGSDIGESLTHAITGFDWETAGGSLGTFATGLFDTIASFLDKTDWKSLGKGITKAISSFFSKFKWSSVSKTISSLVEGLFDFLTGLFDGIDWMELPGNVVNAISDFFSGFDWDDLSSSLKDLITTALEAALDLGAGIFEQLFELGWKIGDKISKGISETFSNIGEWFGERWKDIKNVFSNVGSWFKEKFSAAWKNIKNAWNGVKTFFSDIWSGIKKVFSSVGSWFKTKFTTAWTNIKNIWNGAKTFFSGVWKNIKGVFGNVTDWFKDKFSKAWEAVKNVFSTGGKVFSGIKEGILKGLKDVINALIDGINKVIKTPFDGLNKALGKLKSVKIAGKALFDFLPAIDVPQIPKLAAGAVIPPNKEFLAVLGDQKHGTNIEAPLSTIEQAVMNAIRTNGGTGFGGEDITLNIRVDLDGREVFRNVQKYDKEQFSSTGVPSFMI